MAKCPDHSHSECTGHKTDERTPRPAHPDIHSKEGTREIPESAEYTRLD